MLRGASPEWMIGASIVTQREGGGESAVGCQSAAGASLAGRPSLRALLRSVCDHSPAAAGGTGYEFGVGRPTSGTPYVPVSSWGTLQNLCRDGKQVLDEQCHMGFLSMHRACGQSVLDLRVLLCPGVPVPALRGAPRRLQVASHPVVDAAAGPRAAAVPAGFRIWRRREHCVVRGPRCLLL